MFSHSHWPHSSPSPTHPNRGKHVLCIHVYLHSFLTLFVPAVPLIYCALFECPLPCDEGSISASLLWVSMTWVTCLTPLHSTMKHACCTTPGITLCGWYGTGTGSDELVPRRWLREMGEVPLLIRWLHLCVRNPNASLLDRRHVAAA